MAGKFENVLLFICAVVYLSNASQEFKAVHKKYDYFDWEFFKASTNSRHENIVLSPFSHKVLISILKDAAKEGSQTHSQLIRVLSDILTNENEIYKNATTSLVQEKNHQYALNLDTKIYFDSSLNPTNTFLTTSELCLKTSFQKVNFSAPNDVVETVNRWAALSTFHYIRNMTSINDIKGNVLLASANRFEAFWEEEFEEDTLSFTTNDQKITQPAISRVGEFYYLDTANQLGDSVKILRIPYKVKYAMTIILPYKPNGLQKTIMSIRPGQIHYLQKSMKKKLLQVTLPKFQFETTSHAKEALEKFGITNIYEDSGELPELGPHAIISDIIQKTKISVSAKGSLLLNFPGNKSTNQNIYWDIEVFKVDHPFAFCIEDEDTGTLVFAGQVYNPTFVN